MRDRVSATIAQYRMLTPGMRVGVAVSGGADSVCLLHVLRDLSTEWNLKITVVHLNHQLRGEHSDGDQAFVESLADSFGYAKRTQAVDLRNAAAAAGSNLEEAGREARRAFFHRLIADGTVQRIATAHTRSDQSETVLFRFLRGSFTTGLSGIRPVTHEGLIRPFINVDRVDIEQYLRERSLPWREDSTNRDLTFARNRIRHELLPELAANWNPGLPGILAQHATLAREDDEYWTAEVARLAGVLFERRARAIVISIDPLRTLPHAVSRRLIRAAIEEVKGNLRQIDFSHVDQVYRLAEAPDGHGRVQIPGVDVFRSFDWVRFAAPRTAPVERDWEIAVHLPGEYATPAGDIHLECAERTQAGTLGLDWNRVQAVGDLLLRNWRPGDRYHPAGTEKEDKIKTMFQDQHIPLWERAAWPVLTAGRKIVWSLRFGPAAEFAATEASDQVLQMKIT